MTMAKKILLIDDDDDLREALADQLMMMEEFDVYEAEDGHRGLERAKAEMHDLIILDIGLPDVDGREVCRLMRKQGVKCPVIMLTGHHTDADTILGLDSGANDFVAKPFKFPVLLARIRAQLRQHEQSEDAVFTIGPFTFRPSGKLLLDEASNNKVGSRRRRRRSSNISIARATRWSRARCCSTRSGAITPVSRRIRSRRISTGCARRSSATRATPSCCSPNPAATAWRLEPQQKGRETNKTSGV